MLTGVEGFVTVESNQEGHPLAPIDVQGYLHSIRLELFEKDKNGQEINETGEFALDDRGYFRIPQKNVHDIDPDFGSDYWLRATCGNNEFETCYVPTRRDMLTRVDVTFKAPPRPAPGSPDEAKKRAAGGLSAGNLLEAPSAISTLFQQFAAGHFLLAGLMQRLPQNPGLHIGVVHVKDSGLQVLWSVRFYLKAPVQDRSPRFVSKGMIRLQRLTPKSFKGAARPHYIKIVWSGHADATQLDLASRRIIKFPLGFDAGIVPSVKTYVYTAGLSLKPISLIELYAGVGFRKGYPTSFVYGITLDVEDILGFLFGKITKTEPIKEPTKSATSAPSASESGQQPKHAP